MIRFVDDVSGTDPSLGRVQRQPQQTLDPDAFMQLLVAQMRYQDPMNGMDQQAFMQQVATLSSMQQQLEINQRLGSLVAQTELGKAVELIGRNVTALVGEERVSGEVTGLELADGRTMLRLGNQSVPFGSVTEVR